MECRQPFVFAGVLQQLERIRKLHLAVAADLQNHALEDLVDTLIAADERTAEGVAEKRRAAPRADGTPQWRRSRRGDRQINNVEAQLRMARCLPEVPAGGQSHFRIVRRRSRRDCRRQQQESQ